MPAFSVPQHLTALERANEVRLAQAKIREQLRSCVPEQSRRLAALLLTQPTEPVLRFKVVKFVASCRGFGPAKAGLILNKLRIDEAALIEDLPEIDRARLAGVLEEW